MAFREDRWHREGQESDEFEGVSRKSEVKLMRTITLIYDGTFNTYRWLKAMMWARNEFHDLGYKIKYASIFDYVPYPKSTKVPYEGIKLKWDTIGRFSGFSSFSIPYWPKF